MHTKYRDYVYNCTHQLHVISIDQLISESLEQDPTQFILQA